MLEKRKHSFLMKDDARPPWIVACAGLPKNLTNKRPRVSSSAQKREERRTEIHKRCEAWRHAAQQQMQHLP
jgi:hypothetical protein